MADGTADKNKPGKSPAGRSPLNRRTFTQGAIGVAAVAGAAGLTGWSASRHAEHGEREPAEISQHLVAARIADAISRDPAAAAWKAATAVEAKLMQQYMVAPRLQPEGMISAITLRSMHNGKEIGFHVSWGDVNQDDLEAVNRFKDSVAVQLPVQAEGPVGVVMGQPGRPVHVLHWRASWQRTVKGSPRTVRDVFPNAVNDVSPEDIMNPVQARGYYPSLAVGNPMATRERTSAVEELVAEGYGTITSHAKQRAEGNGVYAGGRWEVVIVVPMTGGENQATLHAGESTRVALAVWDGSKGDRGARKQWANWIGLELGA